VPIWQLKQSKVTICDLEKREEKMKEMIPREIIENKIYLIRGQKVMFDRDLAVLYGVPVKRLNEQVKRNIKRFPADFMFQLTLEESESLRSQIATLDNNHPADSGRGKYSKYLSYAFTEQGVAMLSSVLNSERAIQVNIAIMRVFVNLKKMLSTHKELAVKLKELESKIEKHDEEIQLIFEAIRKLMSPPPEPPKRRIGFRVE
jgi:phage regulator Rha-like protein